MKQRKYFFLLLLIISRVVFVGAADWKETSVKGFFLKWQVEGKNLNVVLSTATKGWVGVGFDPTQGMKDANMIVGYVDRKGRVFVQDFFGDTPFSVKLDKKQGGKDNLSKIHGVQENGRTEISFTIPLDSGEATDRPLVEGQKYKVLFASHTRDKIKQKHTRRTATVITL